MSLNFQNLDSATRELMLSEVERDIQNNCLYISQRLNDTGVRIYPSLLKDAIKSGSDDSLAQALLINTCMKTHEERKTKNGVTIAKVPYDANETLAEGEFNRFYIRALCIRALQSTNIKLEVYRAKAVLSPRSTSQKLIGRIINPETVLKDLRTHQGVDTALGLPPGPNSGLSIKVV